MVHIRSIPLSADMMSRDMRELQKGVARFDHTLCCQVMHMHALCIVKRQNAERGEKPVHTNSTFPLMGVVTHFEAMYSLFQGKP